MNTTTRSALTLTLPPLRFVGHAGALSSLPTKSGNTMFVPDSNLLLNLRRTKGSLTKLPPAYQEYLRVVRRHVGQQWHERKSFIPVNPSYAAFELSRSGTAANKPKFDEFFYGYLRDMHGVWDVDPRWGDACFDELQRYVANVLPSFAAVFEKTFMVLPAAESPSDSEIEEACDELFAWVVANVDELSVIGGPAMYVATYAVAGSPDARHLMKVKEARKGNPAEVAKNVAWDFVYLQHQEPSYLYRKYDETIFCTSDAPLAALVASKIHRGPRYEPALLLNTETVEVDGELTPFKFRRLDPGTKLGDRLLDKYLAMLGEVSASARIRA